MHAPVANDLYNWVVYCTKKGEGNFYQQAYRITASQDTALTMCRYGTAEAWENWYAPYLRNSKGYARTVSGSTVGNYDIGVAWDTQYKKVYFYGIDNNGKATPWGYCDATLI